MTLHNEDMLAAALPGVHGQFHRLLNRDTTDGPFGL